VKSSPLTGGLETILLLFLFAFSIIMQKKRVDEKTGHYSFTVYARSLYITWADCENWTWNCLKEKR
jgi:hypothetical protein